MKKAGRKPRFFFILWKNHDQNPQKQLTILCAATVLGGALLWNGGSLRAQEGFAPLPKLTRDEAAKYATLMLHLSPSPITPLPENVAAAVTSAASRRQLGVSDAGELFNVMALQLLQESQALQVQSQGDKTATVVVENNPNPPARPLVLIEEDGAWGVDLVETYAQWNNLQGAAKAQAIYKLTGVILDELPRNEEFNRHLCQTNLKQIQLGILQYVQDYDEKFPLAKGWSDIVQPYVKSRAIFNCPSLPKGQRFGYAYNAKLSGKMEENLLSLGTTVSVYETSVLKPNAYGTGENLAFRHAGGANYAFADGHVKWFAQSQTPSFNLGPLQRYRAPVQSPGAPPATGPGGMPGP